jgi:hypothetical protein
VTAVVPIFSVFHDKKTLYFMAKDCAPDFVGKAGEEAETLMEEITIRCLTSTLTFDSCLLTLSTRFGWSLNTLNNGDVDPKAFKQEWNQILRKERTKSNSRHTRRKASFVS